MTATQVILRGLADFEGQTVGVFLAGLDCGDFPVTGAKITIPLDGTVPAEGDSAGFMTARYLTQVSALHRDWGLNTVVLDGGTWNVPCVIGFRYRSRGQRLRPVTPQESGAANGPAFGKLRRNHEFAVLVNSTAGISFGTDFNKLRPMLAGQADGTRLTATELFSGIYSGTVDDPDTLDGMLAWEVTGPYSAKVAAVGGFLATKDH